MKIVYDKVSMPTANQNYVPVDLSRETMEEHRSKILEKIEQNDLDVLVVYGDREHGANFAYLTGFETRFEESLLILHRDGRCFLMLGNENLKMSRYSFISGNVIHVPHFSLPYQPMEPQKSLVELMREAGVQGRMKVGCAGWKYFTSSCQGEENLIDIPFFIVNALRTANPEGSLENAGGLFLDASEGLRTRVNANEIAHYEFGAGLASSRVLAAMNEAAPGKTELEVAEKLSAMGQPITVTTICAAGERFTNAVVFPRNRKMKRGDRFSLTMGLRGGLSSRAGYLCENREELPGDEYDYVEKVAIPYYRAAVHWYETVGIGVSCGELYRTMEKILPKDAYHWTLNPGHYTGADEWTSSPIYPESQVVLVSGMILQMDIIPSVPGYGGTSAEDGIVIADEELRRRLRGEYPDTWMRMQKRREYMRQELGISLKEEVLPMSDICGYLRPLLLNKEYALKKSE